MCERKVKPNVEVTAYGWPLRGAPKSVLWEALDGAVHNAFNTPRDSAGVRENLKAARAVLDELLDRAQWCSDPKEWLNT